MADKNKKDIIDKNDEGDNLVEKIVALNRVAKVIKGGRHFSFTALVVVGNGQGQVGYGYGKANEVPDAIKKASSIARSTMFEVAINNGTLAHEMRASYKASKVILRPASEGTGLIAGGAVRAVLEAAGIVNVLSKSLGSNNPINLVTATIKALKAIRDPKLATKNRLEQAKMQKSS
ncbi:MAG: 30S ribosomal protein S5 [Dehalococcoidia bacterium]|nr:30S ribosomal protein S5 [Dehalococcoidia bacterium]